MTKEKRVEQELYINGKIFKEKVLEYSLNDGVWTFRLDNGVTVVTTGSIIFCSDGKLMSSAELEY